MVLAIQIPVHICGGDEKPGTDPDALVAFAESGAIVDLDAGVCASRRVIPVLGQFDCSRVLDLQVPLTLKLLSKVTNSGG